MPTTREQLRAACFGAGWVTTHRHIPAMLRHGGFEILTLADRRGERARREAERLEVPWAEAASVGELAVRDDVDVVTCGTAPQAHAAIVRGALEAGKHVITEKPFTMSVAEGEELVALARDRGLILAVVHNFQFAASSIRLRRWMQQGRIGEVRGIWAMQLSNPARRLPEWYDELPFGLFYDESPHLIYMVRSIAGVPLEPVSVTVHGSPRSSANTPAQIDAQMRAGDAPVTLQMNFEAPLSEWHVAVLGDEGLAVVDMFRDIAVRVPNDKGHLSLDVLRTSAASTWHHWRGYVRSGIGHLRGTLLYGNEEVFRRFHDAVRSGVPPQGIAADDALEVLRLQHWILEASA